jgi:hypothetical protein
MKAIITIELQIDDCSALGRKPAPDMMKEIHEDIVNMIKDDCLYCAGTDSVSVLIKPE